MMQKYEFMWDRHLRKTNVPKHKVDLEHQDIHSIRSAPNHAWPEQRKLERKEATKMKKAGIVIIAVAE